MRSNKSVKGIREKGNAKKLEIFNRPKTAPVLDLKNWTNSVIKSYFNSVKKAKD